MFLIRLRILWIRFLEIFRVKDSWYCDFISLEYFKISEIQRKCNNTLETVFIKHTYLCIPACFTNTVSSIFVKHACIHTYKHTLDTCIYIYKHACMYTRYYIRKYVYTYAYYEYTGNMYHIKPIQTHTHTYTCKFAILHTNI